MTDDKIILSVLGGISRIGHPTEPDSVIELPEPNEDDDRRYLELDSDDLQVAKGLLQKHSSVLVRVVENPTDEDLSSIKSEAEQRQADAQAAAEKHMQKKRRKKERLNQFDPKTDSANNLKKTIVAKAYTDLLDAGETEKAEHLRNVSPLKSQASVAKNVHYDVFGESVI